MKTKVLTFFIIGLLIYLIDIAFNSYDKKEIFISEDEIISLITAWESQVGRSPNEDEINRIINEYIEEEILYREALNLGLEIEPTGTEVEVDKGVAFDPQFELQDDGSALIPEDPMMQQSTQHDDNLADFIDLKTFIKVK